MHQPNFSHSLELISQDYAQSTTPPLNHSNHSKYDILDHPSTYIYGMLHYTTPKLSYSTLNPIHKYTLISNLNTHVCHSMRLKS